MGRFVVRRSSHGLVVLFVVLTALFFLVRLSGSPAAAMLGTNVTPEALATFEHEFGFDQPLPVQYVRFMADAAQLRFGVSIATHRDALSMVWGTLPNTLILSACAVILGLLIALPVGVYAAVRRNSMGSFVVMLGALIGVSIPGFWFGLLLILLFAVQLHWLPAFRSASVLSWIMPSVTLSVSIIARQSRLIRAGMLDALQQDYIRTAHTKGLSPGVVVIRHALKNAVLPAIATLGVDLSYLVGGALIVEQVFAVPGIGRQLLQAISNRDYPVIQATVFVVAVLVVVINFAVDVAYGYIDPRISTESLE